jgi:hypothetical protein
VHSFVQSHFIWRPTDRRRSYFEGSLDGMKAQKIKNILASQQFDLYFLSPSLQMLCAAQDLLYYLLHPSRADGNASLSVFNSGPYP